MRKHSGLLRLLMVLGVVFWGVIVGVGQTTTASQSKQSTQTNTSPQAAAPAPQDKVWFKDPNSIMPMRKMTIAERHAAAQRNRERKAKAEAQRKQNAPANQGVR